MKNTFNVTITTIEITEVPIESLSEVLDWYGKTNCANCISKDCASCTKEVNNG